MIFQELPPSPIRPRLDAVSGPVAAQVFIVIVVVCCSLLINADMTNSLYSQSVVD